MQRLDTSMFTGLFTFRSIPLQRKWTSKQETPILRQIVTIVFVSSGLVSDEIESGRRSFSIKNCCRMCSIETEQSFAKQKNKFYKSSRNSEQHQPQKRGKSFRKWNDSSHKYRQEFLTKKTEKCQTVQKINSGILAENLNSSAAKKL